MKKRIVVGIAGASGVTYGVRCLSLLRDMEIETHLIISDSGKRNIEIETEHTASEVEAMADYVYDDKDVGAWNMGCAWMALPIWTAMLL